MIYEEMQKQQIKMLENDNRLLAQEIEDYKERIDKAIQYLANCDWNNKDFAKIYDILMGVEKWK